MHSIDCYVGKPWFGTADLYVLAFPFVALERNAGHTPQSICDIRIGQAGDDFGREHLHDVVGGLLTIERFDLAALAFAADNDLLAHSRDFHDGVSVGRSGRRKSHLLRKRLEANVRNLKCVFIRGEIDEVELALGVRGTGLPHGLQLHASADERVASYIGDMPGYGTLTFLGTDG